MLLEIKKALKSLNESKTILYPTDTVWGIGCDATDEKAVEKIYKLKQRSESKSLIVLVDSWEMLLNYVEVIPEKVSCILTGSSKPTTVIYNNPKRLAKNVIASDNTVAIRIVNDGFAYELIKQFGMPIVSSSANISGEPNPKSFEEINPSLLDSVDYIVNLPLENKSGIASQIVKVHNDGKIEFLRK
ncbi:MAG: L-threonylcarbamoyladenylate synthase [Flavobacteriaceae bacterium]